MSSIRLIGIPRFVSPVSGLRTPFVVRMILRLVRAVSVPHHAATSKAIHTIEKTSNTAPMIARPMASLSFLIAVKLYAPGITVTKKNRVMAPGTAPVVNMSLQ